MNINDYRKKYAELQQNIAKAEQDLQAFKISECQEFNKLFHQKQEEHLKWFAEHIDCFQKHKEYIKKSPSLSNIVIDFMSLYGGGCLVSGAGFSFGSGYKIFLGDLLDIWDLGFCYNGYPIVHCELCIHWNTECIIKYIKNKKIESIRKRAKGTFSYLPELKKEIFDHVKKANINSKFPDMQMYKNIDLMIKNNLTPKPRLI